MELVEFLLARIGEDEAAARRGYNARVEGSVYPADLPVEVTLGLGWWQPARVLAECDAKRRIVERVSNYESGWGEDIGGELAMEDILTYLALPYADHPDYQQEWKQ